MDMDIAAAAGGVRQPEEDRVVEDRAVEDRAVAGVAEHMQVSEAQIVEVSEVEEPRRGVRATKAAK